MAYTYTKEDIEKRKQQRKNLDKIISQEIENYKTKPEDLQELLAFKSKFHNYSMRNTMLIKKQNPYSEFVSSYKGWKELGYSVKKGQTGIKILTPATVTLFNSVNEKGEQVVKSVSRATKEEIEKIKSGAIKTREQLTYKLGTVFDITQTTCPPKDYPKVYSVGFSSKEHKDIYKVIKGFAVSKGIVVEEVDLSSITLRGNFTPSENVIRINQLLNDTEKLSTLTHELGHAILHKDADKAKLPTEQKELEADSFSTILSAQYQIPLTEMRKAHFNKHLKSCYALKDFNIEDTLQNVNNLFNEFNQELVPFLENTVNKASEKSVNIENDISQSEPILSDQIVTDTKQQESTKETSYKDNQKSYSKGDNKKVIDNIKASVPIIDIAQALGKTVKQTGNHYTLKENDSVIIYPDTNSYYRFSTGKGGDVISFTQEFGDMQFKQAIDTLKNYIGNPTSELTKTTSVNKTLKETSKKQFVLPEKFEGKPSRVFGYLANARSINYDVLKDVFNNKSKGKSYFYEDKRHNVVFVGRDDDGKDVFASWRSTLTGSKLKGDVASSDQSKGWRINNKGNILFVCESPIDALSLMSMKNNDTTKNNYIATCGTGKDKTVYDFIKTNPNINKVVLVNDNDKAGREADKRISDNLKENYPDIEVQVLKPAKGKDINEQLQIAVKAQTEQLKQTKTEPAHTR